MEQVLNKLILEEFEHNYLVVEVSYKDLNVANITDVDFKDKVKEDKVKEDMDMDMDQVMVVIKL